jgi:hypothetical protein
VFGPFAQSRGSAGTTTVPQHDGLIGRCRHQTVLIAPGAIQDGIFVALHYGKVVVSGCTNFSTTTSTVVKSGQVVLFFFLDAGQEQIRIRLPGMTPQQTRLIKGCTAQGGTIRRVLHLIDGAGVTGQFQSGSG